MNGRHLRTIMIVGLCAVLLGAAASVVRAGAKEDIVDRMAKRLEAIKKYKAEAKLGETFDGQVEAVKAAYLEDQDLKKLVTAENADRKEFYALGAKELGTSAESFALSAGKRNFRKAGPAEWLKLKGGAWVQKKDLKE
jgi:uncharacterized protein YdbL (DUF1318 family)